ncbi:MAG: hypothetical protein CMG08_05675 [Candidatus Marinimicrobia bacterium]|nr:hypothetical protein [Candidatus Neomarinimicrobiota bacterium]|tara:strand:- start:2180 stop:2368 length:189 start_codon:yes stop_codon:yes gene_type:complete
MVKWFKKIDDQYPFLIIVLLFSVGSGLALALLMGYINRPKVIGFAMIGEGFYLLYKRYFKKN